MSEEIARIKFVKRMIDSIEVIVSRQLSVAHLPPVISKGLMTYESLSLTITWE